MTTDQGEMAFIEFYRARYPGDNAAQTVWDMKGASRAFWEAGIAYTRAEQGDEFADLRRQLAESKAEIEQVRSQWREAVKVLGREPKP